MPRASVIIPTYNREDILSRSIDSVLQQSFSDIELLVVDDGSTDNTKELIREYSDSRIRYIHHGDNKGANAARNTGIRKANSKYISFLDSDDEFSKNHIESVVKYLDESTNIVGGVYTSQYRCIDDTVVGRDPAQVQITSPDQVINYYPANGFSAFTFRREVFNQVGVLDENLPAFQDRDFLIRLTQFYNMAPISAELVNYYIHDDRISSDPDRKLSGLAVLENKHKKIISRSGEARLHYTRGYLNMEKKEIKTAQKEFFAAVKRCPTEYRYITAFVFSLFGVAAFRYMDRTKKKVKNF